MYWVVKCFACIHIFLDFGPIHCSLFGRVKSSMFGSCDFLPVVIVVYHFLRIVLIAFSLIVHFGLCSRCTFVHPFRNLAYQG